MTNNPIDYEKFLEEINHAELYNGSHFSTYVEKVKIFIRNAEFEKAEFLLLRLIEATEAGDNLSHWGVAPWYYERLAILYKKQKRFDEEIEILERFSNQRHAPGVTPLILLKRLNNARKILR